MAPIISSSSSSISSISIIIISSVIMSIIIIIIIISSSSSSSRSDGASEQHPAGDGHRVLGADDQRRAHVAVQGGPGHGEALGHVEEDEEGDEPYRLPQPLVRLRRGLPGAGPVGGEQRRGGLVAADRDRLVVVEVHHALQREANRDDVAGRRSGVQEAGDPPQRVREFLAPAPPRKPARQARRVGGRLPSCCKKRLCRLLCIHIYI